MVSRRARGPRIAVGVLLAVVLLLIGIWLGGHPSSLPSPLRNAFVNEQAEGRFVNSVIDTLTHDYYRPLNRTQLVDKGLSAMVASLSDPYSHYYDPAAYNDFLNDTNPHLSGVGIDVMPDPLGLRVVDVFPGSPAAHAGLQHGDVIVAVGSTSLAGRSASFSSSLIKGPVGTRVKLTVQRGSHRLAVTVVRANIVIPVASATTVTYHGVTIGDLALTSFTQGSSDELRSATEKELHAGVQALILDLRENGGGLLEEGVSVASLFIPDGTIVSTAGRAVPRQVYVATGDVIAPRIPMVVLVDQDTASAAEIVTAALQDRRRALVVGTRTYGKGVFQEIDPLSNGGALDITVGEYFTPDGKNLGGGGVTRGAGIAPNVYAATNPSSSSDHALTVAEQTVAAEVK